MNNSQKTLQLFYSYARDDKKLCRLLIKHLASLRRQDILQGWHDRCISPGQEWGNEIATHLEQADIVLLLISASFVDSDYCWGIEMKRAIQKHNAGKAVVIPIILRPVDIEGTPFNKLESLPKNGKPITRWSDRHEALANVAIGIRHVATRILDEKEKERKETREAQLAIMSPVERKIELFIQKHKQDPDVYLLRSIEEGQWKEEDIVVVAKRIRQIMIEMKKWRPRYSGKNTARAKKHKRTLKVMQYLDGN